MISLYLLPAGDVAALLEVQLLVPPHLCWPLARLDQLRHQLRVGVHGLQTVHEVSGKSRLESRAMIVLVLQLHIFRTLQLSYFQDPADEDKMLFCDLCDRGYHIYCVGLKAIPSGRHSLLYNILLIPMHILKRLFLQAVGTVLSAVTVKAVDARRLWATAVLSWTGGHKTICSQVYISLLFQG